MLNYNSPIKENKNYSDLTIKEIYPVMKLNIRGKKREFFTNVGKTLNMILPSEANTSTTTDKLTSIWFKIVCVDDPFLNSLKLKGHPDDSNSNIFSPSKLIITNWSVTSEIEPKLFLEIFENNKFSSS